MGSCSMVKVAWNSWSSCLDWVLELQVFATTPRKPIHFEWLWYFCLNLPYHRCIDSFLDSHLHLTLIYIPVIMQVPQCLACCCFILSSEITKCESSTSVLQGILIILGPLNFCINFNLSISSKTVTGIVIDIVLTLFINLAILPT
jgi:hypothetical protein